MENTKNKFATNKVARCFQLKIGSCFIKVNSNKGCSSGKFVKKGLIVKNSW